MKIKKNIVLFYLGYILHLFSLMFTNIKILSEIIPIFNYLSIIVLFFSFILSSVSYSKKELFNIVIIGIITLIGAFISTNILVFSLLIFLLSFQKKDFKQFIKNDFIIKIILILIVLMMYYLNLTDPYIMYRSDGTIRTSMGFAHPNLFSLLIMSIVLDYYYLYFKKVNIINICVFLLTFLIIKNTTDSRTTLALLILLFVIAIIAGIFKENIFNNKMVILMSKLLFCIFIVLSFTLIHLYNENNITTKRINELLSYRISLANYFVKKYDINFFGNDIKIVNTRIANEQGIDVLVLDNGYLNLLYFYGIYGLCFVYSVYMCILNKCKNKKDYKMLVIIVVYLILGFTENSFYKVGINPFVLYISTDYFNRKKVKAND